jgi:hypothetical protein
MTATHGWPVLLASVVILLGCSTEPESPTSSVQAGHSAIVHAEHFAAAGWTDPVNLGPVVNSADIDVNAALSPDERTLYFVSNRPGGLGGNDIWASHRKCKTCDWETPYNLGAPINSAAAEGAPTLSHDGRMLFFFTTREDSLGLADIYVSHRVGSNDHSDDDDDGDNDEEADAAWGTPQNLGPFVNNELAQNGSYYTREGGRNAFLYFNHVFGADKGSLDIYRAELGKDGMPLGPAVAVSELNSSAADQKVAISNDGLELFLSSNRTGTTGNFDIWRFTRRSVHQEWSTPPEHLGAPINTAFIDSQPNLSRDGRTLIFTSNRPGGFGNSDLWMSTRMREDRDD